MEEKKKTTAAEWTSSVGQFNLGEFKMSRCVISF